MKAIPRDLDGAAVDIEHGHGPLELAFEGRERPFACFAQYEDEEDGSRIEIELAELVDPGEPEGMEFHASLDAATGEALIRPDVDAEVRRLLLEFNRDRTPPVLEWIREEAEMFAAHQLRSENFHVPAEDVRQGRRIFWEEVFGPAEAHPQDTLTFWLVPAPGQAAYALMDSYCSDPDCDCRDVNIAGYRLADGEEDPRTDPLFEVATDFEGNLLEVLHSEIPEEKVRKAISEWQRSEKDLPAILEDRYFDIKEIGARILDDDDFERGEQEFEDDGDETQTDGFEAEPGEEPPAGNNVPGRNAPCPCGSGRKYKKCCLRRDEDRFTRT